MDLQQTIPLTMAVNKAGLAAGTTTTITIGNNTTFAIGGKAYTKNAASNAATPTTDAVTGSAFVGVAANYGSVFVVGLDSSGAIKVSQGSVNALDSSGKFVNAPLFPPLADGICPIGYITVLCGSTASTWTFGSSNLAGPPTGVTFNIVDVLTLPHRPQVA